MKTCQQTVYLAYGALCIPPVCGRPVWRHGRCRACVALAKRRPISALHAAVGFQCTGGEPVAMCARCLHYQHMTLERTPVSEPSGRRARPADVVSAFGLLST